MGVSADVVWEDCDRPTNRVFFEVPSEFGADLSDDPESFAMGCAVPAMNHGERRLMIEGTLCPQVRDGLVGISGLLRGWYGSRITALSIETTEGFRPRPPAAIPRSALFLSGGIDSLFSLVSHRVDIPLDHPGAFRDALILEGFGFFPPDTDRAKDVGRRSSDAARRFAADAGLDTLPITTNLRELEPDFGLFSTRYFGLMLAASAHALAPRLTRAVVAADLEVAHLFPWGSHPLLYLLADSSALEIWESGGEHSRLEKTRFLAQRPEMLAHIVVCQEGPLSGDAPNCGQCEKCVRTLASLIVAGVPERDRGAFAVRTVDVEAIERLNPGMTVAIPYFWSEIVAALDDLGLGDLASAGRRLVERSRSSNEWHADSGWRGRARRLDRRLLGGALLRASRHIRSLTGRNRSTRV